MRGAWLAIDTATDVASVAAGRPPNAESGAHVQGARRHAAEIVRLVDFTLSRLALEPKSLEGIVLGDGPGSFTGLRIGWATAKGLAQEAGLELRAVPSLMATARAAGLQLGAVPIAAWFDALRGQVHAALYVFHGGRVETLMAPTLATPSAILEQASPRPVLVAGDGAVRYAEAAARWSGVAPVPLESLPPAAPMLLSLLACEGANRVIDDALTAEPIYGRPAEAQARWEAQHGRTLPHSPGTNH
jgi:tRNA threonylcarbamoyladenosine biosynthesis protein TsaB